MKPTTLKRHQRIRQAFKTLPPMPAMKAYIVLGEQFGLSDEAIRKILAKKHPGASLRFRKERPPPRKVFYDFCAIFLTIGKIYQQPIEKSSTFAPDFKTASDPGKPDWSFA